MDAVFLFREFFDSALSSSYESCGKSMTFEPLFFNWLISGNLKIFPFSPRAEPAVLVVDFVLLSWLAA